MDIIVKAPLMADRIKDLLDNKAIEGANFTFVDKKGMEMSFKASGDNIETMDIAAIVKKAIRSTDYGKGIYFSVIQK